jgi:hypothetical protein
LDPSKDEGVIAQGMIIHQRYVLQLMKIKPRYMIRLKEKKWKINKPKLYGKDCKQQDSC